jgi:hypothetical protein
MATVTRTANVDLDSWFHDNAGGNMGNGRGGLMTVGYSTGPGDLVGSNRFGIRIPRGTLFDGIPNADVITAFDLKLRAINDCVGIGGTVRFFLERGTTALAENTLATGCAQNTSGTAGAARWGGPTRDTADRAFFTGAVSNGAWITVPALALGKWWYAHPEVTALVLVAVAANADGSAAEESNSARRATFYTRHTASVPYASLTFNDNLAPYAPTDLNPPDGSADATTAGTSMSVSARHTDPEGNAATRYQAQAFAAGTTDVQADAGTGLVQDSGSVTATTAHNALRSHTFTGLAARTDYEWRFRFYDGQWGPWSLLQTAGTAYKPTAVNLAIEPGTLDPLLYASISSGDPSDYITAVEEFVYQDPAIGDTITKWASGKVAIGGSPTRSEVEYGGSPLVFGTQYRRRTIVYNRDDIPSDLTANFYFTPTESVGPNVSPGNIETKLNTTQPTVTLTNPGGGNIDRARVEWLNEAGTVVLNDTGEIAFTSAASRNVQAPAGIYSPGQRPRGRAYIRPTGNANMGPARDFQLHLNTTPGAPNPYDDAGNPRVSVSAGKQAVLRADGVVVTDDSTPDVTFPFRDADKDLGYTEAIARQEVEVRTMADAHFGASPYVDASAPFAELFTLPALTVETSYKTRARYDDNGALRSAFSDYLTIRYSAAPTLSSVLPAAAAVVTTPRIPFSWVYASSGGKAQAGYRLTVRQGQTTLFDIEGEGDDDAYTNDPYLLPDGAALEMTLTVYDTDGLAATVTRTFTTDFTQPPALTGLTITEDTDEKALLIVWNESGLTASEFYAYHVEARTGDGQWRRVTTILSKGTHAFLYRAAVHNEDTIIRVVQDNGWMESEPVEDSGTVVAEGYWVRTASRIDELLHVTGHGPGDTQTRLERLTPIGRPEELILDWGTTGYVGAFDLLTNDRDQIERLRGYKADAEIVMFKFPYGVVRYARITDTPDTDGVGNWARTAVSYIELMPESATF